MRYSQGGTAPTKKVQQNKEVIRVTRPGVMGGLTGFFPVAGGKSMLAVSEVGRGRKMLARAREQTSGRLSERASERASECGGDECMGFGLGATGIPTNP